MGVAYDVHDPTVLVSLHNQGSQDIANSIFLPVNVLHTVETPSQGEQPTSQRIPSGLAKPGKAPL